MSKKRAKSFITRCESYGDVPGSFNFAADLIYLAAAEAREWNSRRDDAHRIPDVLHEIADELRKRGIKP